MPLGYYLGQGLIPLTASSSDDEEGPCELPDGRVVCGPHGLIICGKCCVDYSFMDEVLGLDHGSEDEYAELDEDSDYLGSDAEDLLAALAARLVGPDTPGLTGNRSINHSTAAGRHQLPADFFGPTLGRGTGWVFPTKFVPPSALVTPEQVFSGRKAHISITRYTLPNDAGKGLIRTDGACLNNGQPNPAAGWAFWHGYNTSGEKCVASGRLEKKGPFGDDAAQTSNRAELRAIIAALRFRAWHGEGFHTLVIATDSEYAVEGSTKWVGTWIRNGWKRRVGRGWEDVKNKDLWEVLLGEIERYKDLGLSVELWRIPREWNTVADAVAKEAAVEVDAPNVWTETMGINV
ncbi:RNase H domain protein [Coniochaeta ligniaria NRRL 30616]|uniref:ribonuclease H n=1 Tax=Coniochaeta ligniaria NRRL 30616 TaxID=1408157 RepID=A0A1J7J113_9PEZI|nr:RNase H domain protein [Coniochaeta ligniaria NRRL 30616]